VSVGKLTDSGYSVEFKRDGAYIYSDKNRLALLIVAVRVEGMYVIPPTLTDTTIIRSALKLKDTTKIYINENADVASTYTGNINLVDLLHRRLGHLNHRAIRSIMKGKLPVVEGKEDFCEACALVKSKSQPYPKVSQT
jgi:hypothetical protein